MATETAAAAAGGVTSFMDMPNCNPQTTTIEALENKFADAATKCVVNYSFYFGATNNNADQLKNLDKTHVCGVKLFMGASTGNMLVDRMEQIMQQTGVSGFHFVDEAAPPALLRKLSEEIIKRGLTVSYWTNVRFEKSFTPELCYLLAQSGCIAVSGGLEVASPRILQLINKGITIEIARQTMKNLTEAGIMTHAYLMYGFPTETARETIESLEVVRDMFANGWMQSAFWHRYAMTIHSPSGQAPASVGAISLQDEPNPFANNEIPLPAAIPI
jgi:hypothetical protein